MRYSTVSIILFVISGVAAAPSAYPFGWGDFVDAVKDTTNKVVDSVTEAADTVADAVKDTAEKVSEVVDGADDTAKETFNIEKLREAEKAAIEGIANPAIEAFKWCTSSKQNQIVCDVACITGVSAIAQVAGLPGIVSKGVSAAWCSAMRVTLDCILNDKGCSGEELKDNIVKGTLVGFGVPQKIVDEIKELFDF